MSSQLPRLLFVGAGNIAQSIIKGIIKAQPFAAKEILATAPSTRNLNIIEQTLGCRTSLLKDVHREIPNFKPDYVLICVKPQVIMASISSRDDSLKTIFNCISSQCITLSLLAGIKIQVLQTAFNLIHSNIVRVMLNTAAEIGSTSVLYHASPSLAEEKTRNMEQLFRLLGQPVVRLNNEDLMDVATGVCGSGIAFFYEMIQSMSDIGVKNGLTRSDATMVAAQLSKSAGEMILIKQNHPYQLRDEVASPAGTTIYGLSSWHENSTNLKISQSVQAAIDRAKALSKASESKIESIQNDLNETEERH